MDKVYITGVPRQSRPQSSGLAAYAARKAEKEAASLAPYTVQRDKWRSCYNVYLDGKELDTFDTKAEAVAWIKSVYKSAYVADG